LAITNLFCIFKFSLPVC